MLKSQYEKLIQDKPWTEMSTYFDNLEPTDVSKVNHLDIDPEQWIKFTVDEFDLAQQEWEQPRTHYTGLEKKWAEINNLVGRNRGNSFELNYGRNGDTNYKLKEILGMKNIKRLNALPDTVFMRLLVKMPGHGIAWHHDGNGTYKKMFPDVDHSKVKRFWFSVQDWKDGHAFQVSKTVLTHWQKGDVYNIPFGIGHASTNFGYIPQYTVSFTAIIDEL